MRRDIDPEGLDLYLTFANVPAPHTLFRGIKKLPAAHRLICDRLGNMRDLALLVGSPEAPWPAPRRRGRGRRARARAPAAAVKKRLMSDVPVGAFLQRRRRLQRQRRADEPAHRRPLQTFSVGFDGFGEAENFHDLPYARRVAERFGCHHHEVIITADECRDYLPELVCQQDEPIGDPACLPMHFVCRAGAADGVIVVLVGEGSDEVFGGYDDMAHILNVARARWERVRRLPRFVRAGLHAASRLLGAPAGRVDVLRRAATDEPLYWGLDVVFWDTEKQTCSRPSVDAPRRARPRAAGELLSGFYDELLRASPGPTCCSRCPSSSCEPAARALAHARRQALDGALAGGARAVPGFDAGRRTRSRCRRR